MTLVRYLTIALTVALLQACTTVDRNLAASLGTAGEQATQVLSSQASGVAETLGDLNQWWGVHDALVCINSPNPVAKARCLQGATNPAADPSVTQLSVVVLKGKQAIDTLNEAYAAFVDLAHYNAGQEATAALGKSFADVNSFLSAASALPGAAALTPISTTIEKIVGGVISVAADSKQNQQIRAANTDLQKANDALYDGLNAESKVMTSLLVTLQQEREALYDSGFDAGLIAPTDVLTPVFAQAYPGIRLQPAPPNNLDAVKLAAKNAQSAQDRVTNVAVSNSFSNALATLHAVSAQHQKLAAGQSLNLSAIESQVSNLQANLAQLNSSSAAATTKK